MENWKDLRMFVFPRQPITGWMSDGYRDINIAASLPHKARQLWWVNFTISPGLSEWYCPQILFCTHQEAESTFSSLVAEHIFVTASPVECSCHAQRSWGPYKGRKRWSRGFSSSPQLSESCQSGCQTYDGRRLQDGPSSSQPLIITIWENLSEKCLAKLRQPPNSWTK